MQKRMSVYVSLSNSLPPLQLIVLAHTDRQADRQNITVLHLRWVGERGSKLRDMFVTLERERDREREREKRERKR